MTRYKQAELADEDNSSIGSVQLHAATTSPTMHIRYNTVRVSFLHYLTISLLSRVFVSVRKRHLWVQSSNPNVYNETGRSGFQNDRKASDSEISANATD